MSDPKTDGLSTSSKVAYIISSILLLLALVCMIMVWKSYGKMQSVYLALGASLAVGATTWMLITRHNDGLADQTQVMPTSHVVGLCLGASAAAGLLFGGGHEAYRRSKLMY